MPSYHFQQHGQAPREITIEPTPEGYSIMIGEQRYDCDVVYQRQGEWIISLNGQRLRLFTAKDQTTHYVSIAGQPITLEKTSAGRSHQSDGQDNNLVANMPGQVLEVLVNEGDVVESGQTLVVLEAMKMEMRVKAPHAGIVKTVLCVVGDAVERGEKLVEIEKESQPE